MKYVLILLLLFSSVASAEYLRTIRISSHNTQAESEQALQVLNTFIHEHKNITDLQKEWDFEFKARRSGKHYITIVEVFTQRNILQEVIDTLRINYPDVYVTSLKKKPIKREKTQVLLPVQIQEKIEIIEIQEKVEEVIPVEKPLIIEAEEKISISELLLPGKLSEELIPQATETALEEEYIKYLWQLLSFILLLGILYLSKKMFRYKKENEMYYNSKLIYDEKYDQLSLEIKDREKYLSHASHELRSPMTAIMGLTHIVLDANLEKREKDYIKQIENSASNLLSILNDILDVSKIKAGELRIEKTEFNINDILEYVLNITSTQAKNNNINCIISIDNNLPSHLIGDSLRLGQVLINLLANAVKFTKDGEVSLSLKTISSHDDIVRIEFIISDNGIGMSQEELKTIFESFTQATTATTRKFGGTGLGLSISQELVRMMNGEIKVKSQKEKGTSFSFILPFKLKDPSNKRHYRLPSTHYLNKRILVVDSSQKNVLQLTQMLKYFGYKIHAIPSIEESIVDENIRFDIVIINEKHISEVAIKTLKQMQKKQNVKIVLLSQLFNNSDKKSILNIKIDSYLTSPFNQQNILNVLIDLYSSHKQSNIPFSQVNSPKNILNSLTNKKILVAEDNEVNHKVISGLLRDTPIDITYATNGQEALSLLLRVKDFDLILMDINMPVMDGYEATKEIRKHSEFDDLPIIAFTADVMDEAIKKAMDSGMHGHISKPIIIDIFYKKIHDSLTIANKEIITPKSSLTDYEISQSEYETLAISVGLQHYSNDEEFYHSILKDFKKMYINSALELQDLCRASKYKEARHKAMDIKDVSLSIGAYNLCESAASMEYNFEKGPRSNWEKLIPFYEIELHKLFKDIDSYLKKSYS